MEQAENKVTAFDTLFSTNHIAMLKILLPYCDSRARYSLSVCIKILELNYTIRFHADHSSLYSGSLFQNPDYRTLCRELLPYCNRQEKEKMENLLDMLQSLETCRDILQTMEMMKDIMPDMPGEDERTDENGGGAFDRESFTSLLMGMLSPEQQEMFHRFEGGLK